jgi:hypothetical protein
VQKTFGNHCCPIKIAYLWQEATLAMLLAESPLEQAALLVDLIASPFLSFFLAKKKGTKKNATFSYRSAAKRSPAACFVEACYSNVRYRGDFH